MKKAEAWSLLASLRGPLNTLVKDTERMKFHPPHEPNERCQTYLNDIYFSALQVYNLLNDLQLSLLGENGKIEDSDEITLTALIGTTPLTRGIIPSLASVAHEMRTPINAVIGFSEIISTGHVGPTDDTLRSYAKDVH